MSRDSSTLDELPALSDQDVNILYEIVLQASASPDAPFRALFAAYDAVLAAHGLAPEHDQIYFRYLLRLGEARGPTDAAAAPAERQDLVAKFRALLARLGIQIVVGAGEDDDREEEGGGYEDGHGEARHWREEEQGSNDDAGLVAYEVPPSHFPNRRPTRVHTRRASFNDTGLEQTWLSGGRLDADEPNKSTPNVQDNGNTPLPRRSRGRSADISTRATSVGTATKWKRSNSGAYRPPYAQPQPKYQDDAYGAYSSSDYLASSPPPQEAPQPFTYQPLPESHPSETQMLLEADVFHSTTLLRTARRALHQWHDRSIRVQQTLEDMLRIATNYDHQLLLRQALSAWRSLLAEKQQIRETERFFDQFERRATRARDLFLLNKAFTHWAQTTSDEIARTNVARRHILRTRYFNAWRDITAVNELKCRRVGLRKWFHVWRANRAKSSVDNERAVAIYEENLVKRVYWQWFWGFCLRRAPEWKEGRLKRSALGRLAQKAQSCREMDGAARQTRDYRLARSTLDVLNAQAQASRRLDEAAISHRQRKLLASALSVLRKQAQLAPLSRQLVTLKQDRLLRKGFATWLFNSRLATRANTVYRQSLVSNAFRDWNDALRQQAIARIRDSRIVAEAYYKWKLADRYAMFKRENDFLLLQQTMQTLTVRVQDMRARLGEAEVLFQQAQRRRQLQSAMLKLHRKTRHEEVLERQAVEFRNAHAVRHIVPDWYAQYQHVQQLHGWAADARYYCLTTGALRKWREATAASQRTRRRNAYATVRRRVKMNLVRTCLARWHEKSVHVTDISTRATLHHDRRLFALATALFDTWRAKSQHFISLALHAEDAHTRNIYDLVMTRLVDHGGQILANHSAAHAFALDTTRDAAAEMLKRLKWALFCLRRSHDSALALSARNTDQHRRNMLRYWAEQALQRKALRVDVAGAADPESPSSRRPPSAPQNLFSSLRLPFAATVRPPGLGLRPGLGADLDLSFTPVAPPPRRPLTTGPEFGRSSNVNTPARAPINDDTNGDTPDEDLDDDNEDDEDPDADADADPIDFSATHRAEEWTNYDLLPQSLPLLPTLDEVSEPRSAASARILGGQLEAQVQQQQNHEQHQHQPFHTPLPGYMRTPSKRTARLKSRFKLSSSAATGPNSTSHTPYRSSGGVGSGGGVRLASRPRLGNSKLRSMTMTTPAPFRPGTLADMAALTPQVTPFERKMRAGGYSGGVHSGLATGAGFEDAAMANANAHPNANGADPHTSGMQAHVSVITQPSTTTEAPAHASAPTPRTSMMGRSVRFFDA